MCDSSHPKNHPKWPPKPSDDPTLWCFFPYGAPIWANLYFGIPASIEGPWGQINNLSAKTGSNKGQLTNLVEAICHQFRERDEEDLKKLNEWQRRVRVRACCSSVRSLLVRSPTNKRRPPNEGWTEKRRLLNETLSRRKRWWTQMGWRGDGFFSHELPRIIHEWLARVLMSRRKRGKRRKVWAS